MDNKRRITFWIIIITIGAVLFFLGALDKNDVNEGPTPTPTPTEIVKATPTPTPVSTWIPSRPPQIAEFPPICNLTGSLVEIPGVGFRTENGHLNYTRVLDKYDVLEWTVTPHVEASVGPNRFWNLPLPNGQVIVVISFDEEPQHKEYTITAIVKHADWINGEVVVVDVPCTGETKVMLAD